MEFYEESLKRHGFFLEVTGKEGNRRIMINGSTPFDLGALHDQIVARGLNDREAESAILVLINKVNWTLLGKLVITDD